MSLRTALISPWKTADTVGLRAISRPARLAKHHATRPYSTQLERRRKFPGSDEPTRRRLWLRNIIAGIGAGAVLYAAVSFYNAQRQRDSFLAYKLVAKQAVSSTSSIFQLEPQETPQHFEDYKEIWRKGIWNVHFKQPQIQIVRAYTPLPPVEDASGQADQLRFLIRRDPYGEVSSYLHSLPVGSTIELRGPNLEYEITPDVKQVVFFAGGTGIAPALQVAHTLFDGNQQKDRKLHIFWANRKREDCMGGISDAPTAEPLPPRPIWSGFLTAPKPKPAPVLSKEKGLVVKELDQLKTKYPGQVTVEYFVNEEDTWINQDVVMKALSRFDDRDFSVGSATPQEQRQILISGPSGFISYLAGPKEWRGGHEEQGGVSKILAHAISKSPHNVKVWKV